MEICRWIDKNVRGIEGSLLFGRYFDSINIEQIENVFFFTNPQFGIDLILTHELLVKSIHLFGEGQKGIKKFPDKLLLDLTFSLPRMDVHKILGNPKETGGGGESFLYKEIPDWDKYLFSDYSLHFQYINKGESIGLITISSLFNYD